MSDTQLADIEQFLRSEDLPKWVVPIRVRLT